MHICNAIISDLRDIELHSEWMTCTKYTKHTKHTDTGHGGMTMRCNVLIIIINVANLALQNTCCGCALLSNITWLIWYFNNLKQINRLQSAQKSFWNFCMENIFGFNRLKSVDIQRLNKMSKIIFSHITKATTRN